MKTLKEIMETRKTYLDYGDKEYIKIRYDVNLTNYAKEGGYQKIQEMLKEKTTSAIDYDDNLVLYYNKEEKKYFFLPAINDEDLIQSIECYFNYINSNTGKARIFWSSRSIYSLVEEPDEEENDEE